jgi:hypothetical protein
VANERQKLVPWLTWQRIQFSPWLVTYLFFMGLCPLFVATIYEWRVRGRGFHEAYFTFFANYQHPSVAVILYWVSTTAFLIWFTYFSKNSRVKNHDRFTVFLMLCGSVAGGIVLAARLLIGQ